MAASVSALRRSTVSEHIELGVMIWPQPAVSLGHFQFLDQELIQAWQHAGIDVGWRPTGGRAVLHGQGITLSAAIPLSLTNVSLMRARRDLAQWLIESLTPRLPALIGPETTLDHQDVCFADQSEPEQAQGDIKQIGVAGLIRDGVYLAQIEISTPQLQAPLVPLMDGHVKVNLPVDPWEQQRDRALTLVHSFATCFPQTD